MANHPSAEKRNRQREKRSARNASVRSAVRTAVKKARHALSEQDAEGAAPLVHGAEKKLARAAAKGVLHVRSASRTTSRLRSALAKLS